MFEEIPFIFGFMIFSVVISYLIIKYTPGPLDKIVKALAVIGIFIHEICHIIMCFITRSPIENVSLVKKVEFEKDPRIIGYYGQVNVYEDRITFLQAFLISFAPLYLSFWLFFSILNFLLNNHFTPILFFISIFLLISLALSAAPSISDLKIIPKAFFYDVDNSLYQILLVILSILTTWLTIFAFNLQILHEIIIYLIITGFYFMYKFGLRLIRNVYYSILEKQTNRIDIRYGQNRRILRRRYKSWKPTRIMYWNQDFGKEE
ncbi:MAG: hypothetical protein ACFFBC_03795 [Promethearchaeota archaeon]